MAKARTHLDFMGDWELSSIGRRLLEQGREFTTVRRIVDAARRVFALRGLAGARMDEIARVARVNKALPYYYFRNKQELHRFVLETMIAQLCARAKSPSIVSMQPADRVCAIVNTTFDFIERNPSYPSLVQSEMLSRRPRLDRMVVAYHRPLHNRVVQAIKEGIARGEFRPVDPDHTVFTIFGMIMYYFSTAPLASQIWKRNVLRPEFVAERRRAVLDFLEHGLFLDKVKTR
jgi:TetR/AcrR family transcriptional regulator